MNAVHPNPYVGPRTFRKEESHLFFGREREASDLIALVASDQLVLFYAQSGAGKSSLINTRLIPYLENKEYEVLPVGRVSGDLPTQQEPDNVFVYNLVRSLLQQEINLDHLNGLSLTDFLAKLNRDDLGFFYDDSPLPQMPHAAGYVALRRVLIIDQFEELFNTHPEAWGKREDFFRQLAQAMQDDAYLWIVLVMREEYIAALDPYAHLLPGGLRLRYYMQRLGREATLKAIRNPVQELRPFAEGVAEKLVDDLCTIKVQQPDGTLDLQPGQNAEPVQLQVVCYSLWENLSPNGAEITEEDLEEIGDVDHTLAKYYEERVKAVSAAKGVNERLIREWFEKKLITATGIRNLVPQEPVNKSGGPDDNVIQALQSDLVRAERRGGVTWYELTHDRLVEPILRNNRAWFEKNLSPLQRQAALWNDQERNESWLLSGPALAELERSVNIHQDELTDLEREFIKASQERRSVAEREQRARWLNRLIAFLGIIVVMLAVFAYQTYLNGQRQARAALVGQLAVLSKAALEEFPQTSLLLAVEANSVTKPGDQNVTSAEETLRAALKNPHGLPVFEHQGPVNTLAFSLDGRWLATGGEDQIVYLWDMNNRTQTGNPLKLTGHLEKISSVAFSRDGHWLASASQDDTAILWDLTTADPSSNPIFLRGQENDINILAFSPDGHWLATGSGDDTTWLWDLTSSDPAQAPTQLIGQGSWIAILAFSPDGHWLATGGGGATVLLWDLRSTDPAAVEPVSLPGHQRVIGTLAFSPDGHWLATGSQDHTVLIWNMDGINVSDNTPEFELTGHTDWVNTLTFSPDGKWLATGSRDFTVRLWDLTVADPSASSLVLAGHSGSIHMLAFNPDEKSLASGSEDHSVRIWNIRSPVPAVNPQILSGHDGPVNALAFSPEGRWLATGGDDGSVRFWDQVNADPAVNPVVMIGHEDAVKALAISPDGRWLATGSDDSTTRLWDLETTDPSAKAIVLAGHTSWVELLAFSPDGRWLATAGGDGDVYLWDLHANDPSTHPIILRGHMRRILTLAFSPTGDWLATGSADWTARLWNLSAADLSISFMVLEGHQGEINALAFSPDGHWLATGSADNTARLWNLRDADPNKSFRELRGHGDDILAIAFSPDGHWLATASGDSTARLWEPRTAEPDVNSIVLFGHDDQVKTLAFSADGHWLATGSFDGTARLWNLRDPDPSAAPRLLPGHIGWVNALIFSPDSRWLATGSIDRTAHLWNLDIPQSEQFQNLVVLSGHIGSINALAFSPDIHWLVTGSEDKTSRLWLVHLDELKSLACTVTGRNFSQNEWQRYFPSIKYHKTCEQWPEGP